MRRGLLIVLALVAVLVVYTVSTYNSLIGLREDVDNSWAQVENQLKRRADLIPNLVATVQGIAQQEQEVFGAIASARSALLAAESTADQIAAARQMDSALGRLLAIVENYPELRSSQNFLALQDQLEGTENRIAVERKRYNDAVAVYNKRIKRFPAVLIANMLGFDEAVYYNPPEEDLDVPEVEFSTP